MGRVSDGVLADVVSKCRRLVFPGEEDFGIIALEAMSAGKPVVAWGKGGGLEAVVDHETGVFFSEPTVKALKKALERAESIERDHDHTMEHARNFTKMSQSRICARLCFGSILILDNVARLSTSPLVPFHILAACGISMHELYAVFGE